MALTKVAKQMLSPEQQVAVEMLEAIEKICVIGTHELIGPCQRLYLIQAILNGNDPKEIWEMLRMTENKGHTLASIIANTKINNPELKHTLEEKE